MKFNCSLCAGMCCVTPPYLVSKDEVVQVLNKGATVYVFEHPLKKGMYIPNIEKDFNKDCCPFFDIDNGNCSIYEERPTICREMKCNFMDKNVKTVIDMFNNEVFVNNIEKKMTRPYFTKEDLEELREEGWTIEEVSYIESISKILTTKEVYDELISKTKEKIKEAQ